MGTRTPIFGLTVKRVQAIEGNFGVIQLHTFTDKEGRTLKWFSSGRSYEEGEVVDIVDTIKRHEEYNGWPTTSLSIVKDYVAKAPKVPAQRGKRKCIAAMEAG